MKSSWNFEIVDSDTPLIHADIKPGEYFRIKMQDNGAGMPAGMIDRIFEPFFTTKPPGKGTGLGLAVVHGIVTSHGGAIGVESVPGRGTTFNVYLPPLAEEPSRQHTEDNIKFLKGAGRILLVDDDLHILRTMERILSIMGFEISVYSSSADALYDFRHSPRSYDLIISDVIMPNLNGEKLAWEILSIRADMPVILYSGSSPPESLARLMESGNVGFVSKPISIETLFKTVAEMIEKSGK